MWIDKFLHYKFICSNLENVIKKLKRKKCFAGVCATSLILYYNVKTADKSSNKKFNTEKFTGYIYDMAPETWNFDCRFIL